MIGSALQKKLLLERSRTVAFISVTSIGKVFKGALSGLRQLLATESHLKAQDI